VRYLLFKKKNNNNIISRSNRNVRHRSRTSRS